MPQTGRRQGGPHSVRALTCRNLRASGALRDLMRAGRVHLLAAGLLAIALAALIAWQSVLGERATAQSSDRPNVVMLLTDDQTLDEMSGLPQTSALIGGQGATFIPAYVSYPLFCPSRAAILTRQYTHDNGVGPQ